MNNPFIIKNNCYDPLIVIDDYSQFSGETRTQVIGKVKNSQYLANNAWKQIVKKPSEKCLLKFYSSNDYIYDLLAQFYYAEKYHKIKTCADIVKFVKKYRVKKVLEFGGGTGQLCLLLCFNTNARITYLDLPGNTFEFAKWRFEKYQADIRMIKSRPAAQTIPDSPYDAIVSDAVLEHVPNLNITLQTLNKALANPGWMYLLFDPNTSQKYPMHLNNAAGFYAILNKLKLLRAGESIWTNSKTVDTQINSILFQTKQQSSQMIFMIRKYLGQIKKLITKSEKGPTFTVY